MTTTEYVILVDENDRELGQVEKLSAHQNNLLHRAFSIFIFSDTFKNEILIQQRARHKYHSPLLWTNACCSHPRFGETVIKAGNRRLHEELGLNIDLKEAGWFYYNARFENGLSEHEIDHVLVGVYPKELPIQPNSEEVANYQWISVEKLQKNLENNPNEYTAWFSQGLEIAIV